MDEMEEDNDEEVEEDGALLPLAFDMLDFDTDG